MSSIPQTYTISDFIEWFNKKQLILDPNFQRGTVWTPSAKVFLIDTILNDLPMPQIFFRTRIDAAKQTTVREVVDGQQRLRAILEFASGKLKLSPKSPNYKNNTYSTLSEELQEKFLTYKLPVVQLINAKDSDVLEVFARLNSYSVKVTPAELRHAEFSEPIKWIIYEAANQWNTLWIDYKVVNIRETVRMKNISLIAEMFMTIENGIGDGGETTITKYYKHNKEKTEEELLIIKSNVDRIVSEILQELGQDFNESTFFDSPNFLILFASLAHLQGVSPCNKTTSDVDHLHGHGVNWAKAKNNLALIAQEVADYDADQTTGSYFDFISATKSTTHRVSSRKTRFNIIVNSISA